MAEAHREIPLAGHEASDVGEWFMWVALGGLILLLIAAGCLAYWLYPKSTLDRTISLPMRHYPVPELQASPSTDMAAFRRDELQRLNGTGWVDRSKGIVHMPIDQAMRKLAADGIPGWPATEPAK